MRHGPGRGGRILGVQVDAERRVVVLYTATPWMGGPDGGDGYK